MQNDDGLMMMACMCSYFLSKIQFILLVYLVVLIELIFSAMRFTIVCKIYISTMQDVF